MTRVVEIAEKIIFTINRISMIIASIILFMLMILTLLDITGRLTIRPILGTFELTYLGLAVIVFLGLGYTQHKKGHISIDILIDLLPPRWRAGAHVLINLLMFAVLCLFSWQVLQFALGTQRNVSGDLQLPIYVFVMIGAYGIFLYALSIFIDLLKALLKVAGKYGP